MTTLSRNFLNFLDWQPTDYVYHRPLLDSKPYQIIKNDKISTIVFNALGVAESDVKVTVEREHGVDYLQISAETKNETLNKTFSVSGKFNVDGETVDKIDYELKDGLLYVEVYFKVPEPSNIKITKK